MDISPGMSKVLYSLDDYSSGSTNLSRCAYPPKLSYTLKLVSGIYLGYFLSFYFFFVLASIWIRSYSIYCSLFRVNTDHMFSNNNPWFLVPVPKIVI